MFVHQTQYPESSYAEGFVPNQQDVVSPEVLAEVFHDSTIPFPVNHDGSVNMATYQAWLVQAGEDALRAFAELSESVTPGEAGALEELP